MPARVLFSRSILFLMLAGLAACDRSAAAHWDGGSYRLPATPTTVTLQGQWEIFPGQLCSGACAGEPLYTDAGIWKAQGTEQNPALPPRGFATYRLRLELPPAWRGERLGIMVVNAGTSFRLLANGRLLARAGRVGRSAAEQQPAIRSSLTQFLPRESALLLELQIANFAHRDGGLRFAPVIGPAELVERLRGQDLMRDLILLGAILIMGLYHVGLFINRREDWPALAFGGFCLLMATRLFCTNHFMINVAFPGISYDWQVRLEYASLYLGVPTFLAFVSATFPFPHAKKITLAFALVAAGYSLHIVLTEPGVFTEYLYQYQIALGLGVLASIGTLATAVVRRQRGATAAMLGMLVFTVSIVGDILYYRGLQPIGPTFHYGLFIFILAQSYLLSRLFAWAYEGVRSLSENLRRTNSAYQRFVPTQFLELLEKSDITDIRLGDQVAQRMTVLFTDIRSFTNLSETMTPEENFNFLNSYLKRMAPIVNRNGGFVDKFIGDAIMALFREDARSAFQTALEMQREIQDYNRRRERDGYRAISVGMGLHTGSLMLGIIGAEERLEGTVISDTVNTAARIEDLTRHYGSRVIVSGEALDSLGPDAAKYSCRLLGRVRVKGKQQAVSIFELLDAIDEDRRELFEATRTRFEEAVNAYLRGDRAAGEASMRQVLSRNPEDQAAAFFLNDGIKTGKVV